MENNFPNFVVGLPISSPLSPRGKKQKKHCMAVCRVLAVKFASNVFSLRRSQRKILLLLLLLLLPPKNFKNLDSQACAMIPDQQNFTRLDERFNHVLTLPNRAGSRHLRAVICKYRLSSFGRQKMKSLKLSQKNGLYK